MFRLYAPQPGELERARADDLVRRQVVCAIPNIELDAAFSSPALRHLAHLFTDRDPTPFEYFFRALLDHKARLSLYDTNGMADC